jgi:hypothetical protein
MQWFQNRAIYTLHKVKGAIVFVYYRPWYTTRTCHFLMTLLELYRPLAQVDVVVVSNPSLWMDSRALCGVEKTHQKRLELGGARCYYHQVSSHEALGSHKALGKTVMAPKWAHDGSHYAERRENRSKVKLQSTATSEFSLGLGSDFCSSKVGLW